MELKFYVFCCQKMKARLLFLFLACFVLTTCAAQKKRKKARISPAPPTSISSIKPSGKQANLSNNPLAKFESSILKFEAEDREKGIRKGGVLFIGSSSIVFWKDLSTDMAPMPVLNRGFGGSTIPEVDYYTERIVFPYAPEMIVFYCGENDINAGASPQAVAKDFMDFHKKVDAKYPGIPMVFLSMKPSLSRWAKWQELQEGNQLIEEYIKDNTHLSFIDVSEVMLTEDGQPDPSIFIQDGLHMNRTGYERWAALMKAHIQQVYDGVLRANEKKD